MARERVRDDGGQGERRHRLVLAYLGAGVVLTGVQAILPALPALQEGLDLSNAEVALVLSAYLLPSVLAAIPSGLLVDRIGRRAVYVGALTLFGLAGIPALLVHSFAILIGARILQGIAFAAILPLSVTMIADVAHGRVGVRLQGHRYVVMTVCDAALPVLGGALVAVAWYWPFSLQLLTLPLAALGWWWLRSDERTTRVSLLAYGNSLRDALRMRGIWSLQLLGFGRFFVKFSVFTYFPTLATSTRGMSALSVGLTLSGTALSGTMGSALCHRLVSRISVTRLLIASGVAAGVAVAVLGMVPVAAVAAAALLLFGFADGLLGVLYSAIAASVGPRNTRGGFLAMTATTRNLGKFLAPVALSGLVVILPLQQVFLIVGAVAATAALLLRAMRPLVEAVGLDLREAAGGWAEGTG